MIFTGATPPCLIVPITGTTSAKLVEEAIEAQLAGADVIEWRIDFLFGTHQNLSFAEIGREVLSPILEQTSVPILLTLRTLEQGGQAKISDGRYRLLFAEMLDTLGHLAAPAKRIGVDLESRFAGAAVFAEKALKAGYTVVVSHHDWNETPDDLMLRLIFEEMLEIPGIVAKLAVTANSEEDTSRLLRVTKEVATDHHRPLIALAMGEAGKRSRLEGWKYGSIATFVAVGAASAPGQPQMSELKLALGR
ncbi:type I 3-dehydroquinate dehydratase [Arcanobacterium hippocoleae]|uniref:3-dehydroquinate dehydratase n=1 Tax=Arcanobacterium hippocoleae TaxID=149017 RepID=A0ABU1T2Y4_9ACTO|nr:type I 3-dehydroquinate dehydratase [Arcanobacterium hippocoleae]MDR6939744.1 3-dehydroquinate dehydratase-1 [Arcanobacterium hippocoleae]